MNSSQILNTVLIVVGGGLLMYAISVEDASPYIKIIGLVVIMFGLYKATNYWVATKDDHKKENEDQ